METISGSVALSAWRGCFEPVVSFAMAQLGTSRGETELVIFTSLSTALAVFVALAVGRLLFRAPAKKSDACCVTDFVQKRRANNLGPAIPPSPETAPSHQGHGMEAFLHEVQHQLAAIQRELVTLKQEREVIDHELIETSTQILQTLGASMMPLEDEIILDSPKMMKPVPSRPVVERPVIDVTPAKPVPSQQVVRQPVAAPVVEPSSSSPMMRPVEEPRQAVPQIPAVKAPVGPPAVPAPSANVQAPVGPGPVAVPMRAPVSAPAGAPGGDMSPRQVAPKAAVVPPAAPVPQMETPAVPAPVPSIPKSAPAQAAPKMSALAMARMKREQEQADATSGAPPAAASNPFGKPKPGPFGAAPLVK